jgi:hypothetical protein
MRLPFNVRLRNSQEKRRNGDRRINNLAVLRYFVPPVKSGQKDFAQEKIQMMSGKSTPQNFHALRAAQLLLLLCCVIGCLIVCGGFTHLSAGEAGSKPLEPQPHSSPLVPSILQEHNLSPEEQLQRRLELLVRERDGQIRSLMNERGDIRPSSNMIPQLGLDEPLRERNRAHDELRRALEYYREHVETHKKDVLETNRPQENIAQRSTLAATNQLRIAECYYEIAMNSHLESKDLSAALAALQLIELNDLEEGDPVRFRYLHAWFLLERYRMSKDENKAAYLTEATTAVKRLTTDFPTSELSITAERIMKQLMTEAP